MKNTEISFHFFKNTKKNQYKNEIASNIFFKIAARLTVQFDCWMIKMGYYQTEVPYDLLKIVTFFFLIVYKTKKSIPRGDFHRASKELLPWAMTRTTSSDLLKMTQRQAFINFSVQLFIHLHNLHHMKSLNQDCR